MDRRLLLFSVPALILLLLLKCTNSPDARDSYGDARLTEGKTIHIPIDSLTSYEHKMMQVVDDSLLAVLNKKENRIQLYSLNQHRLVDNIEFDYGGPDGVGNIHTFHYINQDSIFILSSRVRRIMLANANGKIVDHYSLADSPLHFGTLVGDSTFPLRLKGSRLYFAVLPFGNYIDPGLLGESMEMFYDIDNDSVGVSFLYPEAYQYEKNNYHINFSRTVGHSDFLVYVFSSLPYLFVKRAGSKEISRYDIQSHFAPDELPDLSNRDMFDWTQIEDEFVEDRSNRVVAYDKFRAVYYVFLGHPTASRDPATGMRRLFDEKHHSILIFDTNFVKIGEYNPPKDRFLFSDFFINSEGLWLSNGHRLNPDVLEDEITFTLFTLDRDKK
jgi:hypothetical protein